MGKSERYRREIEESERYRRVIEKSSKTQASDGGEQESSE